MWEPGDKKPCGKRDREICPVKKGYGLGISSMVPLENASMYSIMDKLSRTLHPTLDKCRMKHMDWQTQLHSIKDLIQTNSLPFYIKKVSADVSIDLDPSASGAESQICLSGCLPQVILQAHVQTAWLCQAFPFACL